MPALAGVVNKKKASASWLFSLGRLIVRWRFYRDGFDGRVGTPCPRGSMINGKSCFDASDTYR